MAGNGNGADLEWWCENMKQLGPYTIDNIYCGDSAVTLAKLPDGCIDLTVTSSPYDDMDENFNPIPENGMRKYNGYSWDFKAIASQLWRTTKQGGIVVWVVNDPTIDGSESLASAYQKIYFRKLGFRIHDTMIYESPSNIPTQDRYYAAFEYMIVFSKGKPKAMNFICDSPNAYAGQKKKRQSKIGGENKSDGAGYYTYADMSRRDNIWRYATGKGHNDDLSFNHPAVFPEALARDHILSWSNPGNLILDPFMGSGTTAKMAMQNGRHYLGFDISQEYVDLAKKRVAWANPPLIITG